GYARCGDVWPKRSPASTPNASATRFNGPKRSPSLTQMRRGDLVPVAAVGDYGKPRPAVVVQTDAFPESHASVVVCQLTSDLADAPDFRAPIEPKPENGWRQTSQVMADKPVTIRRERVGQKIGRLGDQDMARLGIGLACVLGLAGSQ